MADGAAERKGSTDYSHADALGEIRVIPKAKAFSVHRQEDGRWVRCYWHRDGNQERAWPTSPAPTREAIRDRWGSGSYLLTWLSKDLRVVGKAPTFTIDDPAHPKLPAYPNAPRAKPEPEPERPAPPAAPALTPDQYAAAMAASVGGGELGKLAIAIDLVMRIRDSSDNRAQREAEERLRREERRHEYELERIRTQAQQDRERDRQYFERLQQMNQRPEDDLDDRIEDAVEERLERDHGSSPWAPLALAAAQKVSEISASEAGNAVRTVANGLTKRKKLAQ